MNMLLAHVFVLVCVFRGFLFVTKPHPVFGSPQQPSSHFGKKLGPALPSDSSSSSSSSSKKRNGKNSRSELVP